MRAQTFLLGWCLLLVQPASGWAQSATAGAIAGTVRDATGAVLPGVTVEAASPALIEKVRIAVTDDQGNYKIGELRPGTYSVTFTLPGFSTFKRAGIELTTGFTAPANAEMAVGSLEETVTVTGASPVVDVQNVRTQNVLSRETLDTLPTGKGIQAFETLTLGTSSSAARSAFDVGGGKGEAGYAFGVHGTRVGDTRMYQDGMFYSNTRGGGASQRQTNLNQLGVQEIVLQTNVQAESETGGVQINVVPKEGGNSFRLYAIANGTGPALQSANINDEHRAQGVFVTTSVKRIYDLGMGLGGPIAKDKLWFYTAHRWWGAGEYATGIYYNKTPHTRFYTPDETRQAYNEHVDRDNQVRLTWQAPKGNKFTIFTGLQDNCACPTITQGINRSPDATTDKQYFPNSVTQGTWNNAVTSRLLFEAGATYLHNMSRGHRTADTLNTDIAYVELSTGFRWGARTEGLTSVNDYSGDRGVLYAQHNQRFAVSYVTGSHAFKTGATVLEGYGHFHAVLNDPPVLYQLRNGLPASLQQWASPNFVQNRNLLIGVFAQDQWTMSRLTMNLGIRYDSLNAWAPATRGEAGMFRAATDFPEVRNIPNWRDISPRVGAAYDVFGDGKTALKASFGRYAQGEMLDLAQANSPAFRIAQNATRTWNDSLFGAGDPRTGNFVPDCVLTDPQANGECARISNLNLGQQVLGTNYDKSVLEGFGVRPYNMQGSVAVQHELMPGLALNVGYFRTSFGNFNVTDNLAVTPADYSTYCVTAPTDPRLGAVSGQQVCGLYDVSQAKFGQVNNLVTKASKFGKQTEVYNGVDIAIATRFGEGKLLTGGVGFGRTVTDNCAVLVDSPQKLFCHNASAWPAGTQIKVAGAYPLPWALQASATFQNVASFPITADRVTPNAEIAPSLGRNLASGATGTATIPLIAPNSMYDKRVTQLDLRLTKILTFGRTRLQGMVDCYNVFNAGTVIDRNNAYGARWQQPLNILSGRLFKLGAQLDW